MTIPDWLHISAVSGSGDTVITITADSYTQIAERITSLLVSGNTKHVDVPVSQSGTPIGITPDIIRLGSASTRTTVSVTSVESWEMSGFTDDTWLTWSQTAGTSGNTVVTLTAATNSTGNDRVAHVNFCSSGVCVPLTVTQTVRDEWDIIATYEFPSDGTYRIVDPDSAMLQDFMSVDGVIQPLASALTANAGVHTIMYKSNIPGVLAGYFFYNVQGLTNVIINDTITDFIQCACLCGPDTTAITLSNNLKTINKYGRWDGMEGVFSGSNPSGSKVSSINLPASLEYIGPRTFSGMNYLTGLTIPSGCYLEQAALAGIYDSRASAITYTSKFSITVPNDVIINQAEQDVFMVGRNTPQYILDRFELVDHVYYAGPFALCVDDLTLTDYTIRDGTRFIGESFLYRATQVSSVTIPSTVECVCNGFLPDNPTGITFTDGMWSSGPVMVLKPTAVTSTVLTIPNNIKAIDSVYTTFNTNTKTINVPGSIKYLNAYTFNHFNPSKVVIDEGVKFGGAAFGSTYRYYNGVSAATVPESMTYCDMFNEGFTIKMHSYFELYNSTIYFGADNSQSTITIPDGIKIIGPYSCSAAKAATEVVIPNSVKEIGSGAFNGATALTSVVIPDSVENYLWAFSDCTSLSSITYSNNIKALSERIRKNNVMTELTIPDGIKLVAVLQIDVGATALTTVNLGRGVKYVGKIGRQGSMESYSNVNTINCYAPEQPRGNPFYVDSRQPSLRSGGVLHYPRGADYSGWVSQATSIGWTAVGDL